MKILVAADGAWVRNQVRAAFVAPNQEVIEVTRGQDVRGAVAEHVPREADRFLAKRADVDAELLKPFDAGTLRRAVKRIFSSADVRPGRAA